MLTLFAAIKPPEYILNLIAPFQRGIEGVRWCPRENLHITVGYFGALDYEQAEILDHELATSPGAGFDLRLGPADVFGKDKPHTLWLAVEPSRALNALHQHVRKSARRANIEMETRKFTPHLSLAYLRGDIDRADLSRFIRRHQNFRSRPFLVDQFSLWSSQPQKSGPNVYEKEANYPLMG